MLLRYGSAINRYTATSGSTGSTPSTDILPSSCTRPPQGTEPVTSILPCPLQRGSFSPSIRPAFVWHFLRHFAPPFGSPPDYLKIHAVQHAVGFHAVKVRLRCTVCINRARNLPITG